MPVRKKWWEAGTDLITASHGTGMCEGFMWVTSKTVKALYDSQGQTSKTVKTRL